MTKNEPTSYRAVKNRCAANITSWQLSEKDDVVISILKKNNFEILDLDIVERAYYCKDQAVYKRAAKLADAPGVVDCSSFIKWVYGELGIWLPRRTPQQIQLGHSVDEQNLEVGDVLFARGKVNYKLDTNEQVEVGHAALYVGDKKILHAASKQKGIVEVSLDSFLDTRELVDVRRYVSDFSQLTIFETPIEREVETSDDIKWIALQHIIR